MINLISTFTGSDYEPMRKLYGNGQSLNPDQMATNREKPVAEVKKQGMLV